MQCIAIIFYSIHQGEKGDPGDPGESGPAGRAGKPGVNVRSIITFYQ